MSTPPYQRPADKRGERTRARERRAIFKRAQARETKLLTRIAEVKRLMREDGLLITEALKQVKMGMTTYIHNEDKVR